MEEFLNKIVLGDCYELIKKIPDKSIDLIYTDVPYLIQATGTEIKGKSEISKRILKVNNIYLQNIRNGIDYNILNEFTRILKKINIFIWCSKDQIFEILKFFIEKNCLFDILVWCKLNPTPATNNNWLPDIEYCLYFRESGRDKTQRWL